MSPTDTPPTAAPGRGAGLSRRSLLGAVGAGATVAALNGTAVAAPAGPGSIDIHGHAIPAAYRAVLSRHGVTSLSGQPVPRWSPADAVAFMDRHGIAAQILSLPDPGVGFVEDQTTRVALARSMNDYLANLASRTTGTAARRFGGFATLPLRDLGVSEIAAARAEAVRALSTLGLDGVTLYSNYGSAFLGDARLRPLLATLSLLGARVQVHPTVVGPKPVVPDVADYVLEAAFNQTRAAVELSYAHALVLFPGIRWIFTDAAGALPFLAYRASLLQYYTGIVQNLGQTALGLADTSIDFRLLHLDTAWAAAPATMRSAKDVVSAGRIMFGSDYPFSRAAYASGHTEGLNACFTPADTRSVERDNALRLFPRLRRALA